MILRRRRRREPLRAGSEAELAVYRCQNGRYEEGIQELEGLLKHGGFRIPDA